MLNFCCLELSVVERTAFRIAPCQYKAPRKLADQIKTWTAAAKINIHILPKTTRANCWSKISIVFNETMCNVP